MTDFRKLFYQHLESRNTNQKRAIETIEGPVMVVAGPGTGKTDVLGLRIGYILEKTQTAIQNILCLTYTEAGAMEMRKRLLEYIGPPAYNGQIYTFHGFCNMVIHENLEQFGVFQEAQPASELEQFEILREILDELPLDNPLKRHTGRIYYEARRLKSLFETMKLEHWTPSFMHECIESWIAQQHSNPDYIYMRRTTRQGRQYEKGDLKDWMFRKEVDIPMQLLTAAVDTFDDYNKKLAERNRYDYHDMLTWVHDAFEEDPDLLARYQERFQYFLVDEFQDTNGIQLAILNQLASHWSRPDIFIVGDDDQSIFRFQGASMHNITAFKEKYDPEVIVLTDNYRSSQLILDAASGLISHNDERLVVLYPEYTKDLVSAVTRQEIRPQIRVYPNWTQEQAALLNELTQLHENGVLENSEVAVVYRRHDQVEDLVHAMEIQGIPLSVKKPVNILTRPLIQNILTILRYLEAERSEIHSGERLLYEMMHYRFFKIPPRDAGVVALACRKRRHKAGDRWRDVIGDPRILAHYHVQDVSAITAFSNLLDEWHERFEHLTIQELFEQILTRAGVLDWIFHNPNRSWHLQLIKTFFDHIKQETVRNPELSLSKFLEDIVLMRDNNIELPVNKTLTEKYGVNFVTAHSAKGMQFDRVYLLGCIKRIWDEAHYGRGGDYKMPDLLHTSTDTTEQDERRLFYVALTRAREHLSISYSLMDDGGRELEPSRFVEEVIESGDVDVQNVEISEEHFAAYCMNLLRPVEVVVPLIDHAHIDNVLENFEMSVSALNMFLECPRRFYFEYILQIPSARKSYFGFGRAIHAALELFFTWKIDRQQLQGSWEDLVEFFRQKMKRYRSHFTQKEFEGHLHEGSNILKTYFEQRSEEWLRPERIMTEYKVRNAHHKGIPVKGDLDRIDVYKDHLVVTDYKTGKSSLARKSGKHKRPSGKDPVGGHYWRQIVFYKILLDADADMTIPMDYGYIDFVQPRSSGEHDRMKVHVSPEDVDIVSTQLTEVYARIREHDFDKGCEEVHCYWCNLVRNEMVVDKEAEMPVVEEL